MADKSPKIIDITDADKTAPTTTSRPILVTNRPVLNNDPMVNPAAEPDGAKPAEPVTHAEKTIKPISAEFTAPEVEKTTVPFANPKGEPSAEVGSADIPNPSEPSEPVEAIAPEEIPESVLPVSRDVAAESQADEAQSAAQAEAEVARENEIETLITSGKYNAPIHPVHRQRSRLITVVLCIVAILLAVAIVDAALDAGLVTITSVPHTNVLKDK